MSLYACSFLERGRLQIMNSDVAVPITATNILAIVRESQTPNSLLNILCLPYGGLVIVLQLLTVLPSINGLRLEHIKIMFNQIVLVFNEYNLAHVLAISISEETLLHLLLILRGDILCVYEVPESKRPIRSTSHKSRKAQLFL